MPVLFYLADGEGWLGPLDADQIGDLQALWERCADFVELVEGQPVSPEAALETFQEMPPGRPVEDKFVLGVWNRAEQLVGVLEGMRHYPEAGTWWIGLLLLDPALRGRGWGQQVVQGFARHVRTQGGTALMLGVVEENQRGYHFWQQVGFAPLRQTEPRPFGQKVQRVWVMRAALETLEGQQ